MKKICVCIAGTTYEKSIESLENVEMAELRLDMSRLTAPEIKKLMAKCPSWVVSVREAFLNVSAYMNIFSVALRQKPDYVDIDFSILSHVGVQKMYEMVKSSKTKLIISYHNFEKTPSTQSLYTIIDEMKNAGADIVKIVCMANTIDDNYRMLHLYQKYSDIISFCMGDKGRMSRVCALMLGPDFMYAAPDKGKLTAKGQFSYSELKLFVNTIEKK
jgi:3-dehydroquinate dehydratase I